eukprot:1804324-Rhodomonas_salina.6
MHIKSSSFSADAVRATVMGQFDAETAIEPPARRGGWGIGGENEEREENRGQYKRPQDRKPAQ